MSDVLYHDLTESIIGCAYEVHNNLGSGFLEKVYENALLLELGRADISAVAQRTVQVTYKGSVVGDYIADIIVDGRVILELKAIDCLHDFHELQLKNYLKATGIEIGLLLNFGKRLEVKRKYVKSDSSVLASRNGTDLNREPRNLCD